MKNQRPSSDRTFNRVKSSAGLALILVLWIVSLLTIMAGSFAMTMRRESVLVADNKANLAAASLAEAGIAVAQFMMLSKDINQQWRMDGNVYEVDFGNAKVRLRLLAEAGKIDINKANQATLQSLFAHAPIDETRQAKLVGAIMDWRDPDDLINLEGAEKDEYRKAGLKYQPRNKPFQNIEELQMVLGMDERTYNWLMPYITTYSRLAQVNLKLAAKEVLQVLPGLDSGLIENYVLMRWQSAANGTPSPEFPSLNPTAGNLPVAGVAASNISNPGNNLAVTIVSEARMPDDSQAVVMATLVKQGGNDPTMGDLFQVFKWQRNPSKTESLFTDTMSELLVKQYAEPELTR